MSSFSKMDSGSFDNPFSDPAFKKEVLRKKGLLSEDGNTPSTAPITDYEVLEPEDIGKESGNMITPVSNSNSPSTTSQIKKISRIPKDVSTIINDASSLTVRDKMARSKEINSALNHVFTEYNEKYGLDLKLDLDNLSKSLMMISDSKSKRVLELYISETLGRVKSLIYLKLLNGLMMLTEHLMDPKTLLSSDELTMADKFVCVEKILQYCDQLEKLKDQLIIPGAETELNKIGDESGAENTKEMMENKGIKDFISSMLKEYDITES